MGARLRFSKMHGAGNDFVVLDLRDGTPAPDAAACARIADRHRGIGCDQILTIASPHSADAVASYRIWNADGSVAGQCGNGARCIAAWLVRDGTAPATGGFAIDSPAGRHDVARDEDGGFVIDMGMPDFAPQSLPMRGCEVAQDEYVLELDGIATRFGAVSMGNPHAVIEAADLAHAPVRQLGAALQAHAAFPASVNVGFVEVVASDHLRLRVFERGAGETLACGSGACAAVAVLTRRGRLPAGATVAVDLPGGRLRIQYDPASGHVRMGGPAAFVFDGTMFGEDQP